MPTKEVAIDIDGTAADVHTPLIARWNREKQGRNFSVSDITQFTIDGTILDGMKFDPDFLRLHRQTWLEDWQSIPVILEPAVLTEAEQYMRVDFVTSRTKDLDSVTQSWVSANYPKFKGEVALVDSSRDKAKRGYRRYVDDYHGLAKWLALVGSHGGAGQKLYLVERPWTLVETARKEHVKIEAVKDANEALRVMIREKREALAAPRSKGS
jgi:hypothetical protein